MNALTRNVRRCGYDIPDSVLTDSLLFADDTLKVRYKTTPGWKDRTFYVDNGDTSHPKLVIVEQDSGASATTMTVAEDIVSVAFGTC